ncbi:toprim domain-containing protein [Sphingomonas sp. MMS12-HWE2-04]|uniref:DUF7146 domain-containing protein n=1 Tax=Sphingomonas sp. MMS12-HWE2-04 TaxID=3234199 RepID=UPI00384C307E
MPTTDPTYPLERAAAAIVESQGGKWRGGGSMCRCPAHCDTSPSLSVRVGETSILFKCFAGCSAGEVIRALRRERLSIPTGHGRPVASSEARSAGYLSRARAIWDSARPITDRAGARYLAGRGITLSSAALRYHPSVPLGPGRLARFRPALVAAVEQGDGLAAIQRIFLDATLEDLARDLLRPKLTLGRPLQGAVRLASAGPVLGLAEGVETALSAAMLLRIPVWATLGSERLGAVAIPSCVRQLVLLPDLDASGLRAERRARLAYEALGHSPVTLWPWHGLKDWNDVLRKEEKGVGERCGWPPDWQVGPHSENLHDTAYR